MSQTHYLKTHRIYFERVKAGEKPFEVRRNDRFFQQGDEVYLLNYEPEQRCYITDDGKHSSHADNAERLWFRVGPVLQGGQFGIEPGYCVFGLLPPVIQKEGGK